MARLILAVVIALVAVALALLIRRRRPDAPTQQLWTVPQQLDRADFTRPAAPWIVVAFTSATCDTCANVAAKLEPMRSEPIAIDIVDYQLRAETHRRYGIDAVPTTVVADADGVVRASFVGPMTATDLWAAVAEAREPGSTPPPEAHTPKNRAR